MKIGDKVKVTNPRSDYPDYKGSAGIIRAKSEDPDYDWEVDYCKRDQGWDEYQEGELSLLNGKRGRPRKAKKVKYIAQYIVDEDPVKEFYSRPELMKWLKQCEDEGVQWDSIKIYPVDKVMKPYKNTKISLRKV